MRTLEKALISIHREKSSAVPDRVRALIESSPCLSSGSIKHLFFSEAERICSASGAMTMIVLPRIARRSSKLEYLSDSSTSDICEAVGIAGWAAWTAADNIRDALPDIDNSRACILFSISLMVMNNLLHRLDLSQEDHDVLERLLGKMEQANLEEPLTFKDHCNMEALTSISIDKSIGAAIPMLALLMKSVVPRSDISLSLKYFRHLILARQLSDDACDWREDIRDGRRTVVTELLRKTAGDGKTNRQYVAVFEKQVKFEVADMILKAARHSIGYARKLTCFTDTKCLEKLPDHYEEMALKILAKRI